MNKGLINVVYVILNYIFNDSSHRLQVTCLRPTLIQLYAYLIYCILDRTVLRPVWRTTNDTKKNIRIKLQQTILN